MYLTERVSDVPMYVKYGAQSEKSPVIFVTLCECLFFLRENSLDFGVINQ